MSEVPLKNKLPESDELLGILSLSIDSHKVHLSQYTFLTDEKHKEIRIDIANKNWDKLKTKIQELEEELYIGLGEVFDEQVSYLKDIFRYRSKLPIRACIKIVIDKTLIATLYSNPESFQYDPFDYKGNTAFYKIIEENADYYLCNTIPKSLKTEIYENTRIDREKVKNTPIIENEDVNDKYDLLWASFWTGDSTTEEKAESAYKSTIVVPMYLLMEELDFEFKEHLSLNSENFKKVILGFLCLDHPCNNFFDSTTDLKIAFIFANMFSLYLIHQFTITQYSTKYKQALEEI